MRNKIKKILDGLKIFATTGAPGGLEIQGINKATTEICELFELDVSKIKSVLNTKCYDCQETKECCWYTCSVLAYTILEGDIYKETKQ